MRKKNKNTSRKKILFIVTALLVLGAAVGFFIYQQRRPATGYQKTSTGYDVNFAPPTPEEKQATEQNKQQVAEDQAKDQNLTNGDQTTPPTTKSTKTPFIVFVGQEGQNVELNGYVPGIFEDDGTCTATFSKGSLRVTGQSKGFKDYNHTTCTPISIDRSKFSQAGNWEATLSYSSSLTTGISQTSTVVIK